jgi:hypothetical protein
MVVSDPFHFAIRSRQERGKGLGAQSISYGMATTGQNIGAQYGAW